MKKAPPVDDGWYRFGSKDNPAHYFEKYESLCKWTGTFPEGWLRCENQAAVNNVCPACNARSAAHEQVEDQPARGDEPSTEMVDELAWFTKKYTDQPRSPKTIYNMLLDLAQMINEATGKTYLECGD